MYTVTPQNGHRYVITGANSGLGKEAATRLAAAGASIVMACRSVDKAEAVRAEILGVHPGADITVVPLDLSDLASVRAAADRLNDDPAPIDVLINNAGVMTPPERLLTNDGHELQWGSNFLGPFVLTNLLLPKLLESRTPRVTTMSSIAAQPASINFADLDWSTTYSAQRAYGQSKLANLLMGLHLARVSTERGWNLVSTMAHPGYTKTNLQSAGASLGSGRTTMAMRIMDLDVLPSMDVAQGVGSQLMAASDPDARNGAFYGPKSRLGMTGEAAEVPVYRSAKGPTLAASVWAVAAATTGVDLPRV